MYYTLFDFQKRAVCELGYSLQDMQKSWHERYRTSHVALTAPTGAGKTVICAALAEGLLFGNEFVKQDPNAVILWLSDSPSLNEQTLNRFAIASDKFHNKLSLKIIESTFAKDENASFKPRMVYFLNRGKLCNDANLIKSHEGSCTFWDILRDAIENPNINFYLLIDEAHHGFGSGKYKPTSENENKTIYEKIVDGQKGLNPAMPVVVGISATIERWNKNMNSREERMKMPPVKISDKEVRKAGIIKDLIELRSPDSSNMKGDDLLSACHRLREFTEHWKLYYEKYGEKLIIPLMVVQVEDNISDETIWDICYDICDILPELDLKTSFAHVLSSDVKSNQYVNIPKVDADKVQDLMNIRVLFAKEAITTGWDCPRAEVLYSRRKRQDITYITQMMGRIVRTPLGHRIKHDEFLNRVACYLPEYDNKTVENVVYAWKTGNPPSDIVKGKETSWYNSIKYKLANLDRVLNGAKIVGYDMINDEEFKELPVTVQYPLFISDDKNNQEIVNILSNIYESNVRIDGVEFKQITKKGRIIDTDSKDEPLEQSLFGNIDIGHYKTDKRVLTTKNNDKYVVKIDFNKIRNFFSSVPKTYVSDDNDIISAFTNITSFAVEKKIDNNFVILFSLINFLVTMKYPATDKSWEDDEKLKEEFCRIIDMAIESHKSEFIISENDIKNRKVNVYFLSTYSRMQGIKDNENVMDGVNVEQEVVSFDNVRKSKNYCRNLFRLCNNLFNSDYDKYYVNYVKNNKFYENEKGNNIPYDDVMAIVRLAAAVNCKEVVNTIETWAIGKIKELVDKYEKNRSFMSEEEKSNWDYILGRYQKCVSYKLDFPSGTFIQDNNKTSYPKHVICDGLGLAYFKLNTVEDNVVNNEITGPFSVAWYRNPSHVSRNSLSILYKTGENEYANFFPDFIFFERNNDGKIVKSIIDPHGDWLADSIAKLRGYVDYVEKFPNDFARVLVVADVSKTEYRSLDLMNERVRKVIKEFQGTMARELFSGELSSLYLKL